MSPSVCMSIPLMVAVTANLRIAPSAMKKRAVLSFILCPFYATRVAHILLSLSRRFISISHPGTGKEALARDRSPSGERVGEQHDHRGHGEGAGGQHQQPRLAVRVIERVPTRSVLLIATARRARSVFTPIRSRWLAVWWNTKSGGWVGLRSASRPRRARRASARTTRPTDRQPPRADRG